MDHILDGLDKENPWKGNDRFAAGIVKLLKPEFIFEIGTYKGYSSKCFAGPNIGMVLTIDINNHDVDFSEFANIVYKNVSSRDLYEIYSGPFIDIMHIDGSHKYEDVMYDINSWCNWLKDDGIILLHDVTNISSIAGFGPVKALFGSKFLYNGVYPGPNGIGIMTNSKEKFEILKNNFPISTLGALGITWTISLIGHLESYILPLFAEGEGS